jgi:signal transduction histidine kinase/DNA-binding response OmpR family regulator
MKNKITILFGLLTTLLYSQNSDQLVSSISTEDSVAIQGLKMKMAQTINPNPDSAFYYSRKMKELAVQKKYGPGICDANYLIAQCFKRVQQNDSAITYFKRTIELSEEIKYYIGAARAYNGLCRTYYLTGEMEASVEYCEKAIISTKKFEDVNNMIFADSHTALATAYSRQNKLQDAIKALLVVDSVHKTAPLRPDIIAAAYQNLGNIYLSLSDYNTSEEYYLRANNEFIKLGANGSYHLNTTHINLGQVYFHKNDLKKADSLLFLSYAFFSSINDERVVGEISTYLGQLKVKTNELKEAEFYFNKGLDIHKRNQRTYEASLNALELADLALKNNKVNAAIDYLKEAENLNLGSNNSQVTQKIYELFSRSYAAANNYKQAFNYKEKAVALKDSLDEVQSSEKIKEIEAIYQTESRDREIALLTSQNELVQQQKKNQRNIFLGGIALTALAGLFFFFQYRNRQKTNKKLQELDKAKSTFFANISHEFRTPLTLIKGPLEDQISEQNLSLQNRKNLHTAQRNVTRLENLVEQLLALSKLESGHFSLQAESGNLPYFIATQAEAFNFSCQEKNIDFQLDLPKHQETDWFDHDALEKIIFNLIGNAIKFTPDGGMILVSGVRNEERFQFNVKNSGSAIGKEELKKLFERFYKSDPRGSGTGIGLALTKELTELHHGSIDVKQAGGFVEFIIDIPVSKSSYTASEIFYDGNPRSDKLLKPTSEEITEKPNIRTEDSPILLVVDDAPDIRNYVTSIFETTYDVYTAADGKEGFELALKLLPDIVISDVMMPVDDGFALTKNLKQHELTSHIPVILLTAKSDVTDKLEGMQIGADSYITKPFSSRLVKATAENLIENRRKLQQRFSQEVILMPKDIAVSSSDEQFLLRLQKVFDEKLTDPSFTIEDFSKEMAVSRMQLHRKIKALTGQTTSEFLRSQRLKLAINLIRDGKITISEIGYTVGFNDPSYFTKCFKQEFGCRPSEFNTKR